MIEVILLYANGQRQQVMLPGIPRTGDQIQLVNGPDEDALQVTNVLWMEGEQAVLVSVNARRRR